LQAYLGQLFKSPEYKEMTDEDKVQEAESAIRDAEKDSREQMITAVLERRVKQMSASKLPRSAPGFASAPVQ
jgi:formate dehydrogenase maturation protein FdhE